MTNTNYKELIGKFYKKINKTSGSFCSDLVVVRNLSMLPETMRPEDAGLRQVYVKVIGIDLPEVEGIAIKYQGEWIANKTFGDQFKVSSYEILTPTTEKALVSYFSSNLFPGIGKKTAETLINKYGLRIIELLENAPYRIELPETKKEILFKNYSETQLTAKLFSFLGKYGIEQKTIMKIANTFGAEAETKIKNNPYCLCEIQSIGFLTCDKLAKQLDGIRFDRFERIQAAIEFILKNHIMSTGDMFADPQQIKAKTLKLLNEGFKEKVVSETKYDEIFSSMLYLENSPIIYEEEENRLYSSTTYFAERYSAKTLVSMLENAIPSSKINASQEALKCLSKDLQIHLDEQQFDAILRSLTNRVSIITGGPGTGKTTIIDVIIKCYEKLYDAPVTLLAPTGKAARRMTQATGRNATTIHSRLGIYDVECDQEVEPITEGLVIVDETSMVDNFLLAKLMNSIRSENCHLIFVGDVDQLPSVGAGACLSEMIESGAIPTTRLTKIYRQENGSTIIENAIQINSDKPEKLKRDDSFVYLPTSNDLETKDAVIKIYEEECKTFGIENVALLTPLRRSQGNRFSCVSDVLNSSIQDVINPRKDKRYYKFEGIEFRVGDRVMQTKNTKTTANGDVGEIIDITMEDGNLLFTINWENGMVEELNKTAMESITLAYSMSIHKSQGSEYDCVIIPFVAEHDCKIFTKKLIYTAVTRSIKKVILIGNAKLIAKTINCVDESKRNTALAERIINFNKSKD